MRHRGEDVQAGSVVLTAGTALRPQELGVAASLGLPQLLVHQRPRVAILSTGDEVAEPGDARKPGQIFDSNRFSLHGLVDAAGGQTTDHGIVPDLYDVLHARLRAAAATADVVITSGGVSVGDHDLVKAVLQDAGGIDFWQVAMQPGRPLAVGRIGPALFFGLPGNPVASMLTFHLFVRPALWKLAGRRELFPPRFHAIAMEAMARRRAGGSSSAASSPTAAPLGGSHHRAPGLRHPHLDDAGQLLRGDRGGARRRGGGRDRVRRAVRAGLTMPHGIETRLIETVTPMVRELVTTQARALADLHYADVRLEVSEAKFAGAENGEAKTPATTTVRASGSACSRAAA